MVAGKSFHVRESSWRHSNTEASPKLWYSSFSGGKEGLRGKGGWSLIGVRPHSCWSTYAENIPQKLKYLEKQDGKRGKKNYTFNMGDISLLCVCILDLQVLGFQANNLTWTQGMGLLGAGSGPCFAKLS